MLEKIAPSLAAGMPVIVKPATASAYLTAAMVREIIASGCLRRIRATGLRQCRRPARPSRGAGRGDVTGSASTGRKLKIHPNIVAKSIPFTMEADSLNCAILGESVQVDEPEFALFIRKSPGR